MKFINEESQNNEILKYMDLKFKKYYGFTQLEIYEHLFGKIPEKVPKNISKIISNEILGNDDYLKKNIPLFKNKNYIIKNIPINKIGNAKERMSFRNLKLSDFKTNWETSYWKNFFENTTFIVICYKGNTKEKNGYRKLDKIREIKVNENELSSMEKTYNLIKKTITTRDIKYLPKPKSFENQILEIAPKRRVGKNSYETFLDKETTNICFMLSKHFLNNKINNEDYLLSPINQI